MSNVSMPSIFEVTGAGHCQAAPEAPLPTRSPYRLYRFLSDLDDILDQTTDELTRLRAIARNVHHLLTESDWLTLEHLPPNPKTGWSVLMLYEEPDYPLTIQTVVWAPGQRSPIHNHATWGVVALIRGLEKNTFWQRTDRSLEPGKATLQTTEARVLEPGDILCLTGDAIHHVEAVSEEPTITFNVYGMTDFKHRLEFNPEQQTAKLF
jgi:predicted metal-dependent enzyme (double-stranded beta helix superfamily)